MANLTQPTPPSPPTQPSRDAIKNELAQRNLELDFINQISLITSSVLNSKELAQQIVDLIAHQFSFKSATIHLINDTQDAFVLAAVSDRSAPQLYTLNVQTAVENKASLLSQVAQNHQILIINHAPNQDPLYPLSVKTKSALLAPIIVTQKLIGVLTVQSDLDNFFHPEDKRLFTILATQLGIALENIHRFEKIERFTNELAESRQFLDSIIENIPTPIMVKEADQLKIVRTNKANELLIGQNRDKLIGKTDYELFPQDKADSLAKRDRQVLQTQKPLEITEQYLQAPEGDIRTLYTRKVPILDADGVPKYILGISEDITDQKRLEKEIQASWERRGQQVQTSTEVAQEIAAAPAVDELFGRVVELVQQRFGYYYVQVYTLNDDQLVMQAGSGEVGDQLKKVRHTISLTASLSLVGQAAQTGETVLVPVVHQDKNWLPNPLLPKTEAEIAVPIKLGDKVLGVLDVQSDTANSLTTEDELLLLALCGQIAIAIDYRRVEAMRIQAEAQLKAYMLELERSNRELQEFAYVASHDLQEPLRKIQAFSDRFQERYQDVLDERGLDYLERMQQAAKRMQTLIIDLLAFSRVSTTRQPFRRVDLQEIVQIVLIDLEMGLQEVGARVNCSQLIVLEADATQMRQLFQNLIGNAMKFRREGEAPIIEVEGSFIDNAKEQYQISVKDNGIGFDEKYNDRIFGMFQRLHGRTEYEGTGVGLAVCRRIVERHNGRITVVSVPGQGSTFTIILPVTQHRS